MLLHNLTNISRCTPTKRQMRETKNFLFYGTEENTNSEKSFLVSKYFPRPNSHDEYLIYYTEEEEGLIFEKIFKIEKWGILN